MVPKKFDNDYLKPESFSLSNDDCRHRKIIDMLEEQGFKTLSVLKDDLWFAKYLVPYILDSKHHWRNLVTGIPP